MRSVQPMSGVKASKERGYTPFRGWVEVGSLMTASIKTRMRITLDLYLIHEFPRLAGSLHGLKGMRWRGLHGCRELRTREELRTSYGHRRFCLRCP